MHAKARHPNNVTVFRAVNDAAAHAVDQTSVAAKLE
jgi:hypothetical protein